jgi:RND family efflux transporter MFP subunit
MTNYKPLRSPAACRAVALAALLALAPAASAQQAPGAPLSVTVMSAKVIKMAPKVALPGTVVSLNDAQLASEVEGRVDSVAEVGTIVPQGGVVASIEDSIAGMQLASDKANVTRLQAQVRYDRNQAMRMHNLFTQNAIAKATMDQASSTRDMDVASLAQAEAAVKKSQYQYDHSQIRAPFPGRVVQRLINPGEYATAGKAIVRLVDINSIEVSVQTPIDSARYMHEGLAVTVDIEGRPVIASVRAIVPVGDIASRTLEARLTLPAGAGLVGDAVKVYVPSAPPHDVLAVPRDALVLREDNTYVFKVDKKNVAQRVAVETGSEDGTLVEVHGLLANGDHVIVRGAERLESGQKVRAILAS